LRTKSFTDWLAEGSRPIYGLFLKLLADLTKHKPYLDIAPLISLEPDRLGGKMELTDCFSNLVGLFVLPIPHITPPSGVIIHAPPENSICRYFWELETDMTENIDVIFFDTRSLLLCAIPETLGDEFFLYVVVGRLSKECHRLFFRDSAGWLLIQGRDIEAVSTFRPDNVSLLGYIRHPTLTNVFRFRLKCNHPTGRPREEPKSNPNSVTSQNAKRTSSGPPQAARRPFACADLLSPTFSPPQPSVSSAAGKVVISVIFWPDPEKSPWGMEERKTVEIECNVTGIDLLNAFREILDKTQNLSKFYEIVKVLDDKITVLSPDDRINAKSGDIYQIQPAVPERQACTLLLMIGSNGIRRQIDIRRIRLSCGHLNLDPDTPQNSFIPIAQELVGPSAHISAITAFDSNNVLALSSDHSVSILVDYGCPTFDRLAADSGDSEGRYHFGISLQSHQLFTSAATYFQFAAEQNHAGAQFRYADCLSTGMGVPIDDVEAAVYYRRAAEQKHVEAQFHYGVCLSRGKGVPADLAAAARMFKSAADQNSAAAQYEYGICLSRGLGVSVDLCASAKYFKLSADQGYALG
jgi:hypothetical protein